MRLAQYIALLALLALPAYAGEVKLSIDATPFGASEADIHAVLMSVSDQLSPLFPDRKPMTIRVGRDAKSGPITLFKRGPNGEIPVLLTAEKTYWCQYAFQFSHELMHIYCNYRSGDDTTDWFEETLCETSSLFVLRRMAEKWKQKPPYPNWQGYSISLADYAQSRIDKRKLPQDGCATLAEFYRRHANELPAAKHAEMRKVYLTMATELLPIFEASPSAWRAVEYLNTEKPDPKRTFKEHLRLWERNSPDEFRKTVTEIQAKLGLK